MKGRRGKEASPQLLHKSYNLQLKPSLHIPSDHEDHHRRHHSNAAKQLQAEIIAPLRRNDSSRDGRAREAAEGLDGEGGSGSGSDLADVADLGDERRAETDEAARREAEDDHVDDDGGVGFSRDPQNEGEEGREEADDDHGVVAADFVGSEAWEDTADDAERYG